MTDQSLCETGEVSYLRPLYNSQTVGNQTTITVNKASSGWISCSRFHNNDSGKLIKGVRVTCRLGNRIEQPDN